MSNEMLKFGAGNVPALSTGKKYIFAIYFEIK